MNQMLKVAGTSLFKCLDPPLQRVKLLRDQLEQVSPEEIAKSLENLEMKFYKSYVEKIQNAMNESLADIQQRIEAKVIKYA